MKEENVWGRKLEEMIHVHVEVEKSISSAVERMLKLISGFMLYIIDMC